MKKISLLLLIAANILSAGVVSTISSASGNYQNMKFNLGVPILSSSSNYSAGSWSILKTASLYEKSAAPALSPIDDLNLSEDFDELNISLSDNSDINYTAKSSDNSIVKVQIIDGKLVVTPAANANGVVTIEINATANGLSTLQEFNITIESVNDTPSIDTIFSDINILEDNGTISYDLNISDIDGDDLNITVESNNTNILTVSKGWNGLLSQGYYDGVTQEFNLTTVENANGMVKITVKADDNNLSDIKTFDINVSALNDAPVLEAIADINKSENFSEFNITLNGSDIDSDNLIYSTESNNSSMVDLNITNNILTISPIEDSYGIVTIDVNLSDGEAYDIKSFTLYISEAVGDNNGASSSSSESSSSSSESSSSQSSSQESSSESSSASSESSPESSSSSISSPSNTAPIINTIFNDITINEDTGVLNYELNVSDIDGDDLNIIMESNNTSIITVSKGWSGVLSQGDYDGVTQEFNLTTKPNGNGNVNISITVTDADGASSSKNFNVTVSPVNDIPVLDNIPDKIVYKNFGDINIPVNAQDIDNYTLSYSAAAQSSGVFELSMNGSIITISSIEGKSGNSDVNVTVSDGDINISKNFNFKILSLQDGDNIEESGDVNLATEGNTTTLTITVPDDNLTLQTKEDTNGSVSHEVDIDGKTTKATSELNGSKVEVTDTGVHTYYEDNVSDIKAEVNATVTGEAVHTMTSKGKTTQATSKIKGAQTVIKKDSDNALEVETSVTTGTTQVTVVAKQNGNAEHSVTPANGKTSKAVSQIAGAQTVIEEDKVVTSVEGINSRSAQVVTNSDGTNSITLNNGTSSLNSPIFEAGSTITIEELNGEIETRVESPLTQSLEF